MLKSKKKKLLSKKSNIVKAPGTLEVKSLKDISNRDSFVFYGRSGTGKTTLSCTFPGPILLLDIKDRGTDSIDSDRDDVKVREIETWKDFEDTYWWLKKNKGVYKTVILDTVTQLQQLAVIKVLEDANKDVEKAGDWGTMSKQNWGTVSSMMKTSITNMRDLKGINKVFLAQDRTFNVDEDGGDEESFSPEVGPRLSPATMAHLNAEVSVIGNTFIKMKIIKKKVKKASGVVKVEEEEKPVYCLRVGPNPVYITKVRKPKAQVLPDYLEDPSYKSLIEAIENK